MKLSMHMLEHWLADQVSSAIIRSGGRTITNARLFTEDPKLEEDCLYVGRTRDFFFSVNSDEVMLINGNDIVSVISTDLNAIFNRVLSAFDYYNDLEHQMYSAIFKPNPEQAVLSVCEHLLGPTFLMTMDYRILAHSQNFADRHVNAFWTDFILNREASTAMVRKMQESVVRSLTSKNPERLFFTEPRAAPYVYGLMYTYYTASRRVIGHLICADDRPISPFRADIGDMLIDSLNTIQSAHLRSSQIAGYDTADDVLLARLIAGQDIQRSGEYLSMIHGITDMTHCCVAVMEARLPDVLPVMIKALGKQLPDSICTRVENRLAVLLWSQDPYALRQITTTLEKLAGESDTVWAVSNVFRGLERVCGFFEHAMYALGRGPGPVTVFDRVAISYILEGRDQTAGHLARHPLVMRLELDLPDSSRELQDTLREYLLCERSVKRAAEKLFVHRNTITYRIDQIKALGMVDFDDSYERQYVLISLMM